MQTIEIKKENAIKAYNAADNSTKTILETLLGKENVSGKITDRVKSFEDALELVGCSDNVRILLDYNGQDKEMIAAQAFAKLSIIRMALNEGWEPDWENGNQYKYYPWQKYVAGSGFVPFVCGCDLSGTDVGSRLCYKSEALARYAGQQFADLYNDLFSL